MDFHTVRYPEDEEKISDRAAQVYRQIAAEDCIGGENGARVYIDYTGGLRDINFLMTAIIRYLEYRGASCREIVYSSFNRDNREKNEICSLGCIYDMYQLLNGVQQFVDTGNAELLSSQEETQNSRQNQGKTWRTEYFYGPFYDQLVMRDFKEFVERLKAGYQDMRDTYPLLEQSEADRFRKLKGLYEDAAGEEGGGPADRFPEKTLRRRPQGDHPSLYRQEDGRQPKERQRLCKSCDE